MTTSKSFYDRPLNVEGLKFTAHIFREMQGLQPMFTIKAVLSPEQKFEAAFVGLLPQTSWSVMSTSEAAAEVHIRALIVREMILSRIEPGEEFPSYAPQYMTSGQVRFISNVPEPMLYYIEKFYAIGETNLYSRHQGWEHAGDFPCCISVSQYEATSPALLYQHPFRTSTPTYGLHPEGFALIMGALDAEITKAKKDGVQLLLFTDRKLPREWVIEAEG